MVSESKTFKKEEEEDGTTKAIWIICDNKTMKREGAKVWIFKDIKVIRIKKKRDYLMVSTHKTPKTETRYLKDDETKKKL